MEEILINLFAVLNERVNSEDIRKGIYLDLIPIIRWHDADLLTTLSVEDILFAEAVEESSDESSEFFDE